MSSVTLVNDLRDFFYFFFVPVQMTEKIVLKGLLYRIY